LDELLGFDLALVKRAPPLLLDRRAALPVQRPEGHVAPLGREREPDGNVDQPEADRSVPDRPHGMERILVGSRISFDAVGGRAGTRASFGSASQATPKMAAVPLESRTAPALWRY